MLRLLLARACLLLSVKQGLLPYSYQYFADIFCFCSGARGVPQPPQRSHFHGAHLDNWSRTMNSLHLVTCSFTWLRCVPKERYHRRQDFGCRIMSILPIYLHYSTHKSALPVVANDAPCLLTALLFGLEKKVWGRLFAHWCLSILYCSMI